MRGAFVSVFVIATGCIGSEAPMEPAPEPEPMALVADANGCHGTATLDGQSQDPEAGDETFGPYIFGHGRFCLHFDARENRYAHLMVESDRFDGEVAPISFVLERPDGSVLVQGWDVAFGQTDTRVFANLELPIDGGTEMDAVLVVDGAEIASIVAVALFERLE